MTPDQIQNELNLLQAELDKLKQVKPDGMIGNSSDSPYIEKAGHYIPQPGEVVEVSDHKACWYKKIFIEMHPDRDMIYLCVDKEDEYRKGREYSQLSWRYCRRFSGEIIEFGCDKPKDYTHLLPECYEFCTEEQAEKWVKVEENGYTAYKVGDILQGVPYNQLRDCSRPIRPIQYHVAVHEATTIEPNPYAVDWSNAPDDADSHVFDKNGNGWFYGLSISDKFWYASNVGRSGFTLPTGLDWKLSKTVRPK